MSMIAYPKLLIFLGQFENRLAIIRSYRAVFGH